jgi:hypothetical protein
LDETIEVESHDPNVRLMQANARKEKEQRQFTPIDKYKPTGNLVYNPELFEKLEKRVTFTDS